MANRSELYFAGLGGRKLGIFVVVMGVPIFAASGTLLTLAAMHRIDSGVAERIYMSVGLYGGVVYTLWGVLLLRDAKKRAERGTRD